MRNFPIKINGIKFDEMNVAENYLEMVAEHPEFAANGGMIYVFPEECQAVHGEADNVVLNRGCFKIQSV